MRVLGVDPGLTRCGIGVVEGTAGRPLSMLGVGVVRTPADAETPDRLVAVERGIEEWLDEYRPERVAVERVFSQHNVRTVMGTAQASAVAMLCAARRGLPVALHTPSEVKAAVTGTGRAEKAQVGAMVTRLLRLDAPPRPADAADALALAICHIWRAPATGRLQQAQQAQQAQRRALEQYRAAQAAGAARAAGASRAGEARAAPAAASRTPGPLAARPAAGRARPEPPAGRRPDRTTDQRPGSADATPGEGSQ
ncbi:crossover junction endodeoxyribonuclease RuvC [Streptomyces sp. Ru87]|uniref:crossover junction endodeoxyribonuclease RuvC n=1 Tax=Streptomyces sp. Ru87 TaxID=2044307 RepID=UPI002683F7DE|nr:crossover junction endodeoxyribonuclease RuvC [Streptomyces sp. Ru87]